MEIGLPASSPGDLARRSAPVIAGGALVGIAAYVTAADPVSGRSPFPACPFHQITGLWCPGCGLTRGAHQLLNGHIGTALGYNLFTPLAIAAVIIAWWSWLRVSWGRSPVHLPAWAGRATAIALPVSVILYGVLRNIPVAPLRALAP